jgi:hypothetical protein
LSRHQQREGARNIESPFHHNLDATVREIDDLALSYRETAIQANPTDRADFSACAFALISALADESEACDHVLAPMTESAVAKHSRRRPAIADQLRSPSGRLSHRGLTRVNNSGAFLIQFEANCRVGERD